MGRQDDAPPRVHQSEEKITITNKRRGGVLWVKVAIITGTVLTDVAVVMLVPGAFLALSMPVLIALAGGNAAASGAILRILWANAHRRGAGSGAAITLPPNPTGTGQQDIEL